MLSACLVAAVSGVWGGGGGCRRTDGVRGRGRGRGDAGPRQVRTSCSDIKVRDEEKVSLGNPPTARLGIGDGRLLRTMD